MEILFTLHDHPNPNAGGMGVAKGLADAYRELGHRTTFVTLGDLPERLPFMPRYVVFPELVAWRLWRSRADVIDASCGDAWLWAALGRRRRDGGRPLLVTRSHGLLQIADEVQREEQAKGNLELGWRYPLYWGGPRLREIGASYRRADLCLLLNEAEREYAIERLGVAEQRARVVDNAIPDRLLGRPLLLDDEPGVLRIAHIGSYLPLKGTRYLAEGLNPFLERHPGARVTFLGTGCDRERVLRDYAPGLHPRIEVEPSYRREQLPELLRGHSVIASATLKEGFPLGTLEAMACGLAAVTAATPGPLQYVCDGENGLVAARADGPALDAALDRLAADPDLLERLRRGAHATAQRYSWNRVAADTLELYREARDRRDREAAGPA